MSASTTITKQRGWYYGLAAFVTGAWNSIFGESRNSNHSTATITGGEQKNKQTEYSSDVGRSIDRYDDQIRSENLNLFFLIEKSHELCQKSK